MLTYVYVALQAVYEADYNSPRCVGLEPIRLRASSVRGLRRVDLADPGADAATDVDRVGEPGSVDQSQDLCRPHAGLAVEHHLLVLRQIRQRSTGLEVTLGNENGSRNPVDVPLDLLSYVDQDEVLLSGFTLGKPLLQLIDTDGVPATA